MYYTFEFSWANWSMLSYPEISMRGTPFLLNTSILITRIFHNILYYNYSILNVRQSDFELLFEQFQKNYYLCTQYNSVSELQKWKKKK